MESATLKDIKDDMERRGFRPADPINLASMPWPDEFTLPADLVLPHGNSVVFFLDVPQLLPPLSTLVCDGNVKRLQLVWRRQDFELNKHFLSSAQYLAIPAVNLYRSRQTAYLRSSNPSAASSRKLGSTKPNGVLVTSTLRDPPHLYFIIEYKWATAPDESRDATLAVLRREGAYQILWYLHVCGSSERFRRQQGAALVNDRVLPVARLMDGTLLLQGPETTPVQGTEYTVDALDSDATFWDEGFGSKLCQKDTMASFLACVQAAVYHAAVDNPAANTPVDATRPPPPPRPRNPVILRGSDDAMASVMEKKIEAASELKRLRNISRRPTTNVQQGEDDGEGGDGAAPGDGADDHDDGAEASTSGDAGHVSGGLDDGHAADEEIEELELPFAWFRNRLREEGVTLRVYPPSVMQKIGMHASNIDDLAQLAELVASTNPSP